MVQEKISTNAKGSTGSKAYLQAGNPTVFFAKIDTFFTAVGASGISMQFTCPPKGGSDM